MAPDRGLTKDSTSGVKGVKSCLTYSMCGNADGSDILPPFVIRKSKSLEHSRARQAHSWAFAIAIMPRHG